MNPISIILEKERVRKFLDKRRLLKQYQKAKEYLLQGKLQKTDFKIRQPKQNGIWSFRINKQFRALAVIEEGGVLIVFKVDNHQ